MNKFYIVLSKFYINTWAYATLEERSQLNVATFHYSMMFRIPSSNRVSQNSPFHCGYKHPPPDATILNSNPVPVNGGLHFRVKAEIKTVLLLPMRNKQLRGVF